jgi:hypothetical protein
VVVGPPVGRVETMPVEAVATVSGTPEEAVAAW